MPQRGLRRREDGETDTLFRHLPFESNYLEDISWDNTTVYGACNNATILSKSDLCSGEGRVIDAVLLPKEFC